MKSEHRVGFRIATIALLVAGGIAVLGLVGWSLYMRSAGSISQVGRAGVRSGLALAAHLNVAYLAALGALGIGALALAWAIKNDKVWAYLVAAIGSGAAIGGVWFVRSIVVKLEDPRFVKKSPWVKAATFVTTVATVYAAVLIIVAVMGWISSRRARQT